MDIKLAKRLWEQLGNIPVDEDDTLEEDFIVHELNIVFEKGIDKLEVWSWFEERFDLSVAKDLMNL